MEFDKLTFMILQCANKENMGYIDNDKVLELMELGYIDKLDRNEWIKAGYFITDKGRELLNFWYKEIRQKHGHEWMTFEDYCKQSNFLKKEKEFTEEEKTKPYDIAYSEGMHNGFKCKKCGFCFCEFCYVESEIPECSKKSSNKIMRDDSKLSRQAVEIDNMMRFSR